MYQPHWYSHVMCISRIPCKIISLILRSLWQLKDKYVDKFSVRVWQQHAGVPRNAPVLPLYVTKKRKKGHFLFTVHTFTHKRKVKVKKILTLRLLLALVRPFLPTKLVQTPLLVTWTQRIGRHVNTVEDVGVLFGNISTERFFLLVYRQVFAVPYVPQKKRTLPLGVRQCGSFAVKHLNTERLGRKSYGKWLKTQ